MSAGYTKLFSSILASTVWDTPPAVTKVWITMMAMADRDGVVEASVPGLAHLARVPRKVVDEALRIFLSPDPDSRTPDYEGRRIEAVPGGWRLLNHAEYRERMSNDDIREKAAERKRKQREREAAEAEAAAYAEGQAEADLSHALSQEVTLGHAASRPSRHTEAEAEAGSLSPSGSRSGSDPDQTGAGARSNVDAVATLNGYTLQKTFGRVRAREVGGLEWQAVKVVDGSATSMAEMINSDPTLAADVVPTMTLLFRKAKAGEAGKRSAEIVRSPSFAFGAWCDQWTSLREEIHGKAPASPKAKPPPESFAERDARVRAEQRQRDREESRRNQAAVDRKVAEIREWESLDEPPTRQAHGS